MNFMAASDCPSSSRASGKYDVYLSFTGVDTHKKFISHLYEALCRSHIETFCDYQIERGDEYSQPLFNEIKESKISFVVFSEGYASSAWCLEELVEIIECKNMYGQIVVPVYCYVDPSDVRNLSGKFGDAFDEHKKKSWRNALREVGNLAGFVVKDRDESKAIAEIVELSLKKLNDMCSSDDKDLIGVKPSIKRINSLLRIGSKDICIVGIWGRSGIGKTTLAKAVFDEVLDQFDDSYFALNVREESESPNGLTPLRQELFSEILKEKHSNIGFTFIKQKLSHRKVLIVFDDVTSFEQIKILVGDLNCLGLGSRIIITTRDKQLLTNYGVENIYELKALSHREALCLFSWYAFQQSHPTFVYDDLSNMVVKYAKGIPLGLKVLGSFLRGKRNTVWLSAINTLERTSCYDVYEVLKISYDGLDNDEKNIFLDIACFLKWENRDFVIKFLNASGFFAEIGISVLIDKCLLMVSNNKVTMHDLLQEMGQEIIRRESSIDPGKRSRLWQHVDIFNVLKKNTGSKAIEGICLDMSKVRDIHLNRHAFSRMRKLRFLKLYNSHSEEDNISKVHVSQGLESVFSNLRYLCWHGCPLKSLESNFRPENLVALDMSYSNVEQLWTVVQHFDNLRDMNLSHSKHLIQIPNLSFAPKLQNLILEGCTSLFEISSSIGHLNKLAILNLRHCKSLKSLPSSISKLKSLEHLNVSGCAELDRLPDYVGDLEALKVLEAKTLAIKEIPSSIVNLRYLTELDLANCCLMELPNTFSQLSSLSILLLGGNNFKSIPTSINHLSKLSYLELGYCELLKSLPELPCSLESLDAPGCSALESGLSVLPATNRRSVRVNFSNCFKLDQSAVKNIVEDAIQKGPHMTMELYSRPSVCICFPGTEIPQWFNYISLGSSINIQLPSGWFNPDFVSFIICVVVEFRNYYDEGHGLVVHYDCKLRSKNDMTVLYRGTLKETRKPLKVAIWEKLPCEKSDDEEEKLPRKKQNVASL
ncbi:disease resistance-like protein DSC1 isoform X2 [Pistacia vera]|uniref:disease resistance-like protein DSC1 isoform X2 n=1 Tax=Pistacia vera TaxID=55513 RepID=UPI001263024F|nr:disease resistance-like protein DSC1 isoform X2 [Pistacia vera]